MTIEYYTERCPHCKQVVRQESGQPYHIEKEWGSPIEVCLLCETPYLTGRKHAGMMSRAEFQWKMFWRVTFTVIRTCLMFPTLGVVAAIFIFIPLGLMSDSKDGTYLIAPALFGLIIGIIYRVMTIPKGIDEYRNWRPPQHLQDLWSVYQEQASNKAVQRTP